MALGAEPTIQETEGGGAVVTYPSGTKYTLSAAGVSALQRTIQCGEYDMGGYTCGGSEVPSVEPSEVETAEKVIERAKEGFPGGDGASIDEFNTGSWWLDEASGVLPSADALVAAGGSIALGAGAFYVGYKIGEHLRALLGWGTKSESSPEEAWNATLVHETPGKSQGLLLINCYSTINERDENCGSGFLGYTVKEVFSPAETVGIWEHSQTGWTSHRGWTNWCGGSCPTYWPRPHSSVAGGTQSALCCAGGGEQWAQIAVETNASVAGRLGTQPFPKEGLTFPEGTHEVTISMPTKPTSVPTPQIDTKTKEGAVVTPSVPTTVTTEYLHEKTRIEKEKGSGVETAPDTLMPELPAPLPNELGTQYRTRLEILGWTNIELATLPETAIDPSVGPEGVAYTVPSAGSRIAKTTKVTIEQNPRTAPVPAEGGAPFFEVPTPKLTLPSFGVACNVFPFGAPCWLVKLVESWSTTGAAPTVTIPFLGGKTGLTLNLASIEPVMTIVRPVFTIAAIVGIVFTFFSFAVGGSGGTVSGGGDD